MREWKCEEKKKLGLHRNVESNFKIGLQKIDCPKRTQMTIMQNSAKYQIFLRLRYWARQVWPHKIWTKAKFYPIQNTNIKLMKFLWHDFTLLNNHPSPKIKNLDGGRLANPHTLAARNLPHRIGLRRIQMILVEIKVGWNLIPIWVSVATLRVDVHILVFHKEKGVVCRV